MDLSDPKTWTEGQGVVASAPHIVVPLLIAVAGGVWWLRGMVDKPIIDGLRERLKGAKDQHTYLARKLDDAQAEIARLEQQLEDKAEPRLLRNTINSTLRYVREATDASTRLDDWLTKPDPGRIVWLKTKSGS